MYRGKWDKELEYIIGSIVDFQGHMYISRSFIPQNTPLTSDLWIMIG